MRTLAPILAAMALTMAIGPATGAAAPSEPAIVPTKAAAHNAMKSAEAAGAPREFSHAHRNILIRLEYLGGSSADGFVHYAATILPDRSVTVIGTNESSHSTDCCDLVRKRTLSVVEYDTLVRQLDATKLSRHQSVYPWPPDSSTVTITLVDEPFDFHHVTFTDAACDPSRTTWRGPNRLDQICKLTTLIQHVTGADEWAHQSSRK